MEKFTVSVGVLFTILWRPKFVLHGISLKFRFYLFIITKQTVPLRVYQSFLKISTRISVRKVCVDFNRSLLVWRSFFVTQLWALTDYHLICFIYKNECRDCLGQFLSAILLSYVPVNVVVLLLCGVGITGQKL